MFLRWLRRADLFKEGQKLEFCTLGRLLGADLIETDTTNTERESRLVDFVG